MKKVLIVQRRLTHYRVPFFESLKERLAGEGISLSIAYGTSHEHESSRNDSGVLEWASRLPTTYFANGRVCWQPFGDLAKESDLVVITHENKLIYNFFTQLRPRNFRVGLWGHGANLQGDPNSPRERVKRWSAMRADWWFAYTSVTSELLAGYGYPEERVTITNNAIDTRELRRLIANVSIAEKRNFLSKLGFSGEDVGVFIGSLYELKRIEFTLQAADALHTLIPTFEFLIVGDGPQRQLVEQFCAVRPWAQCVGAATGSAKALAISIARVMINPGAVGLGVFDSFAGRTPLVTTNCRLHGPEIAYLSHDSNALISGDNCQSFVSLAYRVLRERGLAERLSRGCSISFESYSLDSMAQRFTDGISRCLSLPALNARR